MQRIILLVVCSFLLPFHAFAGEIVNNDFNSSSWGPLSHGSYWTMQSSGGVNNSAAARLQYSVSGTANKAMSINVSGSRSNQFWIEMDVKMQGSVSGGSKFIKFFGNGSGSTVNNMTLGYDAYGNIQKEVAYYMDTICTARLNGEDRGSCTPTHNYSSDPIDMRGGSWGHYKAWVKRADPGKQNGEVKIWWNGSLRAHVSNMNSNPSGTSPFFDRIEFGGYSHSSFSGSTWYLWIDNLYVGTTEKSGSSANNQPSSIPDAPTDFKQN